MFWWDGFSAVLDLTNPTGRQWFKGQLDRLVFTYGVDGFKFDGGDAMHYSEGRMLVPPKSYQDVHPNRHCELFARVGLDYPLNEYRACWKMGGEPIAQRLRDKRHNWEDLRKLIPGIINQGLMGYAFTCPDLIGGGEYLSFRNLDQVDQELIVRAAQCHALMPMMQFSVAPWRVLNDNNLKICRDMATLHTHMGEEILVLAKEAAKTGEPIVRALEYEYPHQGYIEVMDQFLLGKKILVAPVLAKGATERTIHFPPGKWKGDDGSVVKGPMTLKVSAPLSRLPWYRKIR
jgi:alpha-glucosidase (family GH31 glycosyl hydrolase)